MNRRRVSHRPTGAVIPTLLGVLALLLAGCAGGQGGGDPAAGFTDPGMGHVHGLGVDAASGDVLAATHTGLFRLSEGEQPVRVANRWQDTMGFTLDGDRLLGSGHPDMREDLPVHLGLIESTDAGQTWQAVSLQGEADLHALTVAGSDVYGWDSASGAVLASDDGGNSWQSGQTFEAVTDLALEPTTTTLLVTTADGLLGSADRGATFTAFAPQPPVLLLQIEPVSTPEGDSRSSGNKSTGSGGSGSGGTLDLAGVAVDGTLWYLHGGEWTTRGSVAAAPAAFAVTPDGGLLAATEQEVVRSDDGGQTWQQVAVLGASGQS